MPLLGEYGNRRAGNPLGQLLGHVRGRARVQLAGGDQRRHLDVAQVLGAVHVLSGKQFVGGQVTLRVIACQRLANRRDLRRIGRLIFAAEPA
ncbi:hypothetical protein D3C73_1240740 [compost metagenome]